MIEPKRFGVPRDMSKAQAKRWSAYPLQVIGGGPWALNPECRAGRHNTLTAGRGRIRSGRRGYQPIGEKCICPRGRALYLASLRTEAARKRGEVPSKPVKQAPASTRQEPGTAYKSIYLVNSRGGRQPEELERGACRTPLGINIMDSGNERNMRALCGSCPVTEKCLTWALDNEGPLWEGMHGGLLPAERAALHRDRLKVTA